MIWNSAKKLHFHIKHAVEQVRLMDKIKVFMFITYCWALCGLYMTRLFETFFRMILKMPDSWFYCFALNCEHIKILSAHDGKNDVLNKFKLFLKCFYHNSGISKIDGSFNFYIMKRLFDTSMIYCSYMIISDKYKIQQAEFLDDIKRFLVVEENGTCYKYDNYEKINDRNEKINNRYEVPFGEVKFIEDTYSEQMCRDLINELDGELSVD